MIRFAEVTVGQGSGPSCTRCHGKREPYAYRSVEDVAHEIKALCDAWSEGTGPNVRLTGPEPFGHPQLPSLISAAAAAGCARIGVDTDAVALQSEGNARGALATGVRHVRFSLLGGSAGLHDALAGTPGLLDATMAGIAAYRSIAAQESTSVCVTAVVPVCRHNVHDVPAAAGLALSAGVDAILLRLEDGGLDLAASAPWLTAACDTGVVNGVWVEVEGLPFCVAREHALHLSDVVRARAGAKGSACERCALDSLCAGAPQGASADQLRELAPPPDAVRLARAIVRARGVKVDA